MRSQRPFQFDVLRSLSCLAHSKHLPLLPIALSFSLSAFFPLCLAALPRVSPRPVRSACLYPSFLASSYLYILLSLSLPLLLRVPFAKLRSIFHLELRRSLAINPRIHYGLRDPYCSFFATSARCLPTRRSAYLLACLLLTCLSACSPVCLPARSPARLPTSAGHRLRFASRDHLDDPYASSFGYATSFPVIGPTRVFANTAVIRSYVAHRRPFGARACTCVSKGSRVKYIHVFFYI